MAKLPSSYIHIELSSDAKFIVNLLHMKKPNSELGINLRLNTKY